MIKVLVFESYVSGHRAWYVKALCEALRELPGVDLTMAIPGNAMETPEGQTFLKDICQSVPVVELSSIDSKLSVTKSSKARLTLLEDASKKSGAEHVYVPYADGISQAWGMKMSPGKVFGPGVELEGLMMRGSFAYPASNWRDRLSTQFAYRLQRRARWNIVHQLDPLVFDFIGNSDPAYFSRNRLIPELMEPLTVGCREKARKILGLDANDKVIVFPGAVNEYKGADLLIAAFAILDDSVDAKLLLLGKHSEGICRLLETDAAQFLIAQGRIISRNRFATVEEFDSMFAAADLVAVLYPHHVGSSSILIRSAASGKPVLASNWGWIAWAASEFELGVVCQDLSPDTIATSMAAMLDSGVGPDRPQTPKAKSFVRYHSRENHLAHWTAYLRSKLGLPTADRNEFPGFDQESN